MKKNFAFFLILIFCGQATAQKPGESGVLFLLIQPSVRANGMGGTSVVSAENGDLAVAFNPAHAGMLADKYSFDFEFYPTKTKWLPQLASNLRYDAKSIRLSYAGLLGDIDFGRNVILGKSGSKIITKKGWELNLLELVSIRGGRYADPLGKVYYDTDGLGLHLSGALKIFAHISPELNRSSAWKFLSRHLDIAYNSSTFSAAAGHPLGETGFHGISIGF